MRNAKQNSLQNILKSFGFGAVLGFTIALVYGFLYALIGITYTSRTIIASLQTDLLATLFANAISVIIGAMFFAFVFGLIAALIQGVTFGITSILLWKFNSENSASRG
ncbi:MAG TPA: hypothetical protein VF338_12130, partial [Leptolinea sp.]